MKKKNNLLWLILLVFLLLAIPFIVPSALPYAGAEEADLPVYSPVELTNPNPEPLLPLPGVKDKNPKTPYEPHPDGFVYDEATGAAWEYRDGTIYVKIETRTIDNTVVYFTWIQIADASQMRTYYTRAETVPENEASKILKAVVAINGDWFVDLREGIIIRNGEKILSNKSFGTYDAMIVDDEGDFHILCDPEPDAFDPYLDSISQSFVFGPALVVNGELQPICENRQYAGGRIGLDKPTQRQAICQMGKLSYLVLTTEGPDQSKGGGFTVKQLAQLAYDMGAVNAYNLDGGQSACVVLNKMRMNRFRKGGTRPVHDLIYFVTAEPAQ
jgi:exopolysaccharide biosynthesis protein